MDLINDAAPGERSALESLDVLLSASLDRLMDRPFVVDLAVSPAGDGYGHLPLAAWLVAASEPPLTVGITTRLMFHASLCEALVREAIPGEAVTIEIDGRPPDPIAAALARPFSGFARSAHARADAPLPVPAASVALLHADADLWHAGGASWRPSLSEDALLVLHGLGSGDAAALALGRTHVHFPHDGGLSVVFVGEPASPALRALWRVAISGGPMLARLRARFAALGERWRQQALAAHALDAAVNDPSGPARQQMLVETLRDRRRLARELARLPVVEAEWAEARRRVSLLEERLLQAERDRHALELKLAVTAKRRGWRGADAGSGRAVPASVAPLPARAAGSVLFVAGEPDTAGAEFRARRQCRAVAATGRAAGWIRIEDVGPDALRGVDLLVLWRASWSQHVETMIGLARGAGTRIAFDVDDLMVDPALARTAVIDGIRTLYVEEDDVARHFELLRRTLKASDFGIATTDELADQLRLVHAACLVIPNSFDEAAHGLARLERRARTLAPPDGLIRIGYAAGTQSHQRDVAQAVGAIAAVLRERPQARLVLFRNDKDGDMLITGEFPPLAGLEDRIEWREMVAVEALGGEIARFDIAICPLEFGNVFCEAKSEIKYVEAALAQIPCVASPTGPYLRAIAHDRTGLLAGDEAAWKQALLRLVDEPGTRARLGFAAYCDVLWRFGPQRTAAFWDNLLRGLDGAAQAARSHELQIRRGAFASFGTPPVADTESLFAHDTLREAEVSIAITSFNYERFIGEALESVADQTLDAIELVVVDDCSTDGSVETILTWVRANRGRFTRVSVARTRANAGLGPARNAAFAASEAPFIMSLDADNRLLPSCCERLLDLVRREGAAYAYPAIRRFGEKSHPINAAPYAPERLVPGNYIDAMALVAKWAWAAAGGYYDRPDARGWEDYALWCRLAELGQFGVWQPDALAEYRAHGGSMTNAVTETAANKPALVAFMTERHAWLRLGSAEPRPR